MIGAKFVLLMDRDDTVSVNFDEHRMVMGGHDPNENDLRPVPIEWVLHLAHVEPWVDVVAHGNQHLCKEAVLPGIDTFKNFWSAYYHDNIEDEYPSQGYYSYKPSRRDGIRMIMDVYAKLQDNHPIFVAIDDVDLSDMEDLHHMYAWEFMGLVDKHDYSHSDAFDGTPANSKDFKHDLYPQLEISKLNNGKLGTLKHER